MEVSQNHLPLCPGDFHSMSLLLSISYIGRDRLILCVGMAGGSLACSQKPLCYESVTPDISFGNSTAHVDGPIVLSGAEFWSCRVVFTEYSPYPGLSLIIAMVVREVNLCSLGASRFSSKKS
ncbi:hypothetical protein TNIN_32171 [Trichonephila inaurata madagascariensis]|uniref:Uncharacterized protein n=1 Tax=Trichonephila inaurata madagascariensis TaxID=2747483 RepID=A0A8X6WXD6_9ARAC|nr:hypothetical protein TNIN_32171 [Trichonephila inaurata madagascariensis]